MKKIIFLIPFLLISFIAINSVNAAQIVFVVDESGSMAGEHAWLTNMVNDLDTGLAAAGVTDREYGLVGFGNVSDTGGRTVSAMGSLADFNTSSLVTYGGTEDGYSGINYAYTDAGFGLDTSDAINVILITDEDRDVYAAGLNYSNVLSLFGENAILNTVVNGTFRDGSNAISLGVSADGDAYVADGSGGFTSTTGGYSSWAYGTTYTDYVQMAWATGGAAWDLNQLRAGGDTATSFTNAFIDIKVEETVIIENPVPEPGTMILLGTGLVAMIGIRRKKNKK